MKLEIKIYKKKHVAVITTEMGILSPRGCKILHHVKRIKKTPKLIEKLIVFEMTLT